MCVWNSLSIFLLFLRLGCIAFGGPIAHISYFHREFVISKKWYSEKEYFNLVSLCHFLPGPASSQVGIAIGLSRGGITGAIAAWVGFTLPSAVLLIIFAQGIHHWQNILDNGVLQGILIAACAIVADAVWSMVRKFCTNFMSFFIAVISTLIFIFLSSAITQILVIIFSAIFGLVFLQSSIPNEPSATLNKNISSISQKAGIISLVLFSVFFIFSFISFKENSVPYIFNMFYQAGSLVFGGGHVVLPFLYNKFGISDQIFFAGYGATQAVPGPIFSFASYLGALIAPVNSSIFGALLCLITIYLPSFFLIIGVLPFWNTLSQNRYVQAGLAGVCAAMVGLLAATLYDPMLSQHINSWIDIVFLLILFTAVRFFKLPSWFLVIFSALVGVLIL